MDKVLLKQTVPKIGKLLRVFREKTGQNQGDVASKAGISISMLSQIERGVVSPSIDTLVAVCNAVGLDPAELFKRLSHERPVRIHHPNERLKMEQEGVFYEQLMTSTGVHPSEMFLLEVKPGYKTSLSTEGHEGVEIGYVLEGEAVLIIDEDQYKISHGDSIFFNSHSPHQLQNIGNCLFRAVWSISPPHVDYLKNFEEQDSLIDERSKK